MEASHPMFRFAPSGEVVILLREQDHLGLRRVIPEGCEELDRFDVPTTKVLEGVDQEERRRHVLHMPKRRLGQGGLLVVPRVRADLVATEGWADVARAPEGPPARDRAVGDRSLEPVRLRDDPIRHESAVRAARDCEAFHVHERILRGGEVHRLHEIEVISLAIMAPDVREVFRVAVAASRVGEEHRIALRREHLEFMEVAVAESGLRPAVHVEDRRHLPLLGGSEDPRINRRAIARLEGERLGLPNRQLLPRLCIEFGELTDVAAPAAYNSAGAAMAIAVNTMPFAFASKASTLRSPPTIVSAFRSRTCRALRWTEPPSATRW